MHGLHQQSGHEPTPTRTTMPNWKASTPASTAPARSARCRLRWRRATSAPPRRGAAWCRVGQRAAFTSATLAMGIRFSLLCTGCRAATSQAPSARRKPDSRWIEGTRAKPRLRPCVGRPRDWRSGRVVMKRLWQTGLAVILVSAFVMSAGGRARADGGSNEERPSTSPSLGTMIWGPRLQRRCVGPQWVCLRGAMGFRRLGGGDQRPFPVWGRHGCGGGRCQQPGQPASGKQAPKSAVHVGRRCGGLHGAIWVVRGPRNRSGRPGGAVTRAMIQAPSAD